MSARAAKRKRKPAAIWRSDRPLTPLDAFCRRNDITTPELADASGTTRQHTARIRGGKVRFVMLETAKLLALGASRILGRQVALGELFDLQIDSRSLPPLRPTPMTTAQLPTKLERFLIAQGIKPAALARESGRSRQHLVKLRFGRTKHPRHKTKQAIAAACSRLAHRRVTIEELFD